MACKCYFGFKIQLFSLNIVKSFTAAFLFISSVLTPLAVSVCVGGSGNRCSGSLYLTPTPTAPLQWSLTLTTLSMRQG